MRLKTYGYLTSTLQFQSTHPWRMRLFVLYLPRVFEHFNPRTREGCDELYPYSLSDYIRFQSTHPWRMRLESTKAKFADYEISIHAPVKDATLYSLRSYSNAKFQSTHPWRMRQLWPSRFICSPLFQSTHPWRMRPISVVPNFYAMFISIHAPVKDATPLLVWPTPVAPDFNPRTREGCDAFWLHWDIVGGDFNPRTREGCDKSPFKAYFLAYISIHAPVKDATFPFLLIALA